MSYPPKIQRSFVGFMPKPALLPIFLFNVASYIALRLLEINLTQYLVTTIIISWAIISTWEIWLAEKYGKIEVVIKVLEQKLGDLSFEQKSQIEDLKIPQLDSLSDRLLTFKTLEDLELFLSDF
jgi:hypothetical protein